MKRFQNCSYLFSVKKHAHIPTGPHSTSTNTAACYNAVFWEPSSHYNEQN